MSQDNIQGSGSFPFRTDTFNTNSGWVSKGWAGVTTNNGVVVTHQNSYITIGGVNYPKYSLKQSTAVGAPTAPYLFTGAIMILNTGDMYQATNGVFSVSNIIGVDDTYSIKKYANATGSTTTWSSIKFQRQGWIMLTYQGVYYFYAVYTEVVQYAGFVTWSSATSIASTYQPYEPIQLTLSVTGTVTLREYDSTGLGDTTTQSPVTLTKTVDTYKTEVGTSTLASVTMPNSTDYSNRTYTWSVTIDEWEHREYSIVATGSSFNIYSGKVVGNDFLNAYKVQYVKYNSYWAKTTYPKTSLEVSKMSKTVPTEADAVFTFDYDISDITETSTTTLSLTVSTIHKLATGSTWYNAINRKQDFVEGDWISTGITTSSGSLTYDDGTTISLANCTFQSSTITSSVGALPYQINEDTPAYFTITYTFKLAYFGTLTFTDTCYTEEFYEVASVVLEGEKHSFTPDEIIDYGEDAVLKLYNATNTLIKTIEYSDFNRYVSNPSEAYGKYASAYLMDGKMTLSFQVYGIEVRQEICFTYDKDFSINIDDVQDWYVFDPEDSAFAFDFDDLTASVVRHTNTYNNGVVTTTTTLRDVTSDVTFAGSPETLNTLEGQNYTVTVTYENEYGQIGERYFSIWAEPVAPQMVLITGTSTSTHYWDSGVTKFKYPAGLTIKIIFNNEDSVTIDGSDFDTEFDYFRDEEMTVQLSTDDYITQGQYGNRIYVRSKTYGVTGYYNIDWDNDAIASVALASAISIPLGNRLYKYKDRVTLTCTHSSGTTTTIDGSTNPSGFDFKYEDVLMTAPVSNLIVIIGGVEYAISNTLTYITFTSPYPKMVFGYNSFATEYNKSTDIIYIDRLGVSLDFYEENTFVHKCDYSQTCTYSSTATTALDKFQASGNGELSGYAFGSDTLEDVDMDGETQITQTITISVNSAFSNTAVTANVVVTIYEITNIYGIKLLNAKTEYNVGEEFLNENDNTQVTLFYKDANNDDKVYTCYLKNSITALNIYPLKGTILNTVTSDKIITINSATDYNVRVQYSINVKPNYIYGERKTHNLVVLFIADYTCPDGVQRSKYYLVERTIEKNGEVVNSTKETSTGRQLNDGVNQSELVVLGYLDDIGDASLNARVILFKNYIAPIEGSNNITIKYPCYVNGNSDLINKCHFGIMFGNNNSKNRLFVSGNPDYSNKDWHSGQVDSEFTDDNNMLTGNYGYFEDLSVCVYGETDNKIVGYDIVSNDKLLVLKDHSDKETTVYFRQPQLVTAVNASGTAVTGLEGETLYQEEFTLTKGNNSVAGINPKAILNFNGDSVFLSHDKELVGLDLTGIIGDNQRYANTRSYYIDEDLKNQDVDGAFLWSNNKYMFIVLPNKIYVTHFELRGESQYEWFVIDVPNVSSILEKDGVVYYGTSDGKLYKFNEEFKDAHKVFAGYGVSKVSVDEETELFTATGYLSQLEDDKVYYFRPVPLSNVGEYEDPYIYYSLGTIVNNSSADCDFYVDNTDSRNVIELVCRRNGEIDNDARIDLLKRVSENVPVFFNKLNRSENGIACQTGSVLANAWGKKYWLREYGYSDSHLYQVIDELGNIVPIKELYRARLCLRVEEEKKMVNINKLSGQFQLEEDGEILNIVQYNSQTMSAFRGEIIEYDNVEAYYISKPYTMGNLEYFKTVWSFTLTNDSNIPSEIELCYATNKIPMELAKTLAHISKDSLGFSFADFNFAKVDFDKNVVPRTYTHKRVLSGVKFVCFGFKNYNDTNSVLSSMSITYTLPYPSYGGD